MCLYWGYFAVPLRANGRVKIICILFFVCSLFGGNPWVHHCSTTSSATCANSTFTILGLLHFKLLKINNICEFRRFLYGLLDICVWWETWDIFQLSFGVFYRNIIVAWKRGSTRVWIRFSSDFNTIRVDAKPDCIISNLALIFEALFHYFLTFNILFLLNDFLLQNRVV